MRRMKILGTPIGEIGAAALLLCVLSAFGALLVPGRAFPAPALDATPYCGDAEVDALVWDLEVFEGDLVVAGAFTAVGNQDVNRIARWNGSTWSSLSTGMDNDVYTLVNYGGELVAGGWFTEAGGVQASRIASWNGTAWKPLGQGLDGPVRALAVYEGDLIVGGDFRNAGGKTAEQVARWDGSSWSPMGGGFGGGVPSGFGVRALAVHDGVLVAGGFFTQADGKPVKSIARWTGASWAPLGVWTHGGVYSLLSTATGLVAGSVVWQEGQGDWEDVIATWDGTSWGPVGSGPIAPPFSVGIRALGEYQGDLIAAGRFSLAGGVPVSNIARWNGTTWSPLGAGTNSTSVTYALEEFGGVLAVGGEFTSAGGQPIRYLAAWDGETWDCFSATPAAPIALDVPADVDPEAPFSVTVRVGSAESPVADLFGVTGKLQVSDPSLLEVLEVQCKDAQGNPLDLGGDALCFGHIDNEQGVTSWGVTRKSGAGGVSGALAVVRLVLRFGSGYTGAAACVDLSLADVHAIDSQGRAITLGLPARPSEVCVGDDCAVWPGDTNNDGVVDEQDVVAIGFHWGARGPARGEHGCSWEAWLVDCWNPPAATFADAFGDGEVSEEDVLCVGFNWGRTHSTPDGTMTGGIPADFDVSERIDALEAMYAFVRGQSPGSAGMQAVEEALARLIAGASVPRATALYQNAPNPFNPTTTIRFDLAHDGHASLRVYDVAGRMVRTLVDEEFSAGRREVIWDGSDDTGERVSSGLYLYRLETHGLSQVRKTIVLK